MQPDERASSSHPSAESDIARLQRMILAFAHERDWQQFHDPKNLSMAVAVEAGELMDHFRWVTNDRALGALDDPRTRAGVEEEAADVATWVSKTGLRTNPGTQVLEDAACLVFLENEIGAFAARHADYPREKFVDILRKTWRKMSPAAQAAAAALPLPEGIAGLVREAMC